jgi:hypothetical protein
MIHWKDAMPVGPNGKIDRNGLYQAIAETLEPAHEAFGSDPGRIWRA